MEYVSRCTLDVNGQSIEDFKSFTEKEREVRKAVNLMNGTGFAGKTPRHAVSVDYVVPLETAEFDWDAVKNGTLTVELENGARLTFSGVYTLKVGEMKVDGENETVRTIELGAVNRIQE